MTSAKFFKFNYMIALYMIDWLIDCLTSSEQYFSHIQDENSLHKKNQKEGPGMGQHGQRLLTAMLGRVGKFSRGRGPMASS